MAEANAPMGRLILRHVSLASRRVKQSIPEAPAPTRAIGQDTTQKRPDHTRGPKCDSEDAHVCDIVSVQDLKMDNSCEEFLHAALY
jgi:hypothetical protein